MGVAPHPRLIASKEALGGLGPIKSWAIPEWAVWACIYIDHEPPSFSFPSRAFERDAGGDKVALRSLARPWGYLLIKGPLAQKDHINDLDHIDPMRYVVLMNEEFLIWLERQIAQWDSQYIRADALGDTGNMVVLGAWIIAFQTARQKFLDCSHLHLSK